MKGFFSPIERLLGQSTRGKGTGAEFMTELSKQPGYKQAEVEDRDLQTLMALPKMAREEFMAQLKAKPGVIPKERVFRNDPKDLTYEEEYDKQYHGVTGEPHHEDYTLPGGENYREILLQHPKGKFPGVGAHFGDTPNILASIRVKDRIVPGEMGYTLRNKKSGLKGQHYGTEEEAQAAIQGYPENLRPMLGVVSSRGPDKKVLHLEEIQSDWHQQGREKGYATKEHDAQLAAARKQADQAEFQHKQLKRDLDKSKEWSDTLSKRLESGHPDFAVGMPRRAETVNSLQAHNENIMDLMPQVMRADDVYRRAREEHSRLFKESSSKVPDAPFKKNWHELALKRMIQHAAENGYDSIAITPGEEQAKRYGLSKHVGMVSYNPDEQHFQAFKPNRETLINEKGASPERVSELIGKDAATRLMSAPAQMGHHFLEGEDLNVGGEGMKGFYDKMVPKFLNQFGKKYGAQVGKTSLSTKTGKHDIYGPEGDLLKTLHGDDRAGEAQDFASRYPGSQTKFTPGEQTTLHSFPITPEMRQDVMKNGIPMYAEGGEVEVRPTVKDETIQRKVPEMEMAAKALQAGIIDRKEYDRVINKHKPVKPYTFVPQPATDEDAERALMSNKKPQWRGAEQWPAGRKVGLRLDIPAYESHGVWVNSIHDEEGSGEDKYKTSYGPVSSVKNATFDAGPSKGIKVATGEQNKSPFARIVGELRHVNEDEAVEHMKEHLNHPDWAQVGMDPRRHGFFYDRKTMKPVTHSAHVIQIGPLVLAHKPTYGKRESYAEGGAVDNKAKFLEGSHTQQRLYHGTTATEGGKKQEAIRNLKPSKEGALGSGVYLTPDPAFASTYADTSNLSRSDAGMDEQSGQNVLPVHARIMNPLVIHSKRGEDPMRVALVKLGVHPDKAAKMVEKAYEQEGYIGKQVQTRAQAAGHDALMQYRDGELTEVVHYNPRMIKSATGNRGTYDTSSPELSKAEGGSIKPVVRGIIKERVTVSPDKDVMQYELMGVKHFTKKAK